MKIIIKVNTKKLNFHIIIHNYSFISRIFFPKWMPSVLALSLV